MGTNEFGKKNWHIFPIKNEKYPAKGGWFSLYQLRLLSSVDLYHSYGGEFTVISIQCLYASKSPNPGGFFYPEYGPKAVKTRINNVNKIMKKTAQVFDVFFLKVLTKLVNGSIVINDFRCIWPLKYVVQL